MRFIIQFKFNGDGTALAVTGVDGEIADVLLPAVGDVVQHKDGEGRSFRGRVTERAFDYNIEGGNHVDGAITVTIHMDRTLLQ